MSRFVRYCTRSISDFSTTKENLMLKEGELEKSRATLEGIAQEYKKLQGTLQKVFKIN